MEDPDFILRRRQILEEQEVTLHLKHNEYLFSTGILKSPRSHEDSKEQDLDADPLRGFKYAGLFS